MKKTSIKSQAISSLIFVALGYGLLNISIRLMNAELGPFTQVYLRIGLGSVLAIALFNKNISFEKIKKISIKDWMLLIMMGTFGYGIAVLFITLAVLNTTLLNVAVLGSTTPFFALLFSFIFLRKRLKMIYVVLLLLSFYGVYIMATKSLAPTISQFGLGELYAIFFAMGMGVYSIARKLLSKNINNSEITVIVMLIAFISSLLVAVFVGEKFNASALSNPMVLFGLVLGLVLNVVNTQLQNFGFQHLNAVAGTQILLLENIFSPLIGIIFYSEKVLSIELLGAMLIIFGVLGYVRITKD